MSAQDKLFLAIESNNDNLAAEALSAGANPNHRNDQSLTPLMLAAMNGRKTIAQLLISAGADVNACDLQINTALHYAAQLNHGPLVELLLSYHANPAVQNAQGDTPLKLAQLNLDSPIPGLIRNYPTHNPYHDALELRNDIMLILGAKDEISQASYQLSLLLARLDELQRQHLQMIIDKLVQPETLIDLTALSLETKKSKEEVAAATKTKKDKGELAVNKPEILPLVTLSPEMVKKLERIELRSDAVIFSKLNKIISDIEDLQKKLSIADNALAQEITNIILSARAAYVNYRTELCTIPEKRIELCKGRIRIRGNMGFHYLNTGAAQQFADFLVEEDHITQDEFVSGGSHGVRYRNNTFYKNKPTNPMYEAGVRTTAEINGGNICTQSELSVLSGWNQQGQPVVRLVIASKAAYGLAGDDVLEKHTELLTRLNPRNFANNLLTTIEDGSQDVRPENLKVIAHANNKTKEIESIDIVSFDSDESYYPDVLKEGKTHWCHLDNILTYFPQMNDVVDSGFRLQYIESHPILAYLKWNKEQRKQHENYLNAAKDPRMQTQQQHTASQNNALLAEALKESNLPVLYWKGTSLAKYLRRKKMYDAMVANPKITYDELLQRANPYLHAKAHYVRTHILTEDEYVKLVGRQEVLKNPYRPGQIAPLLHAIAFGRRAARSIPLEEMDLIKQSPTLRKELAETSVTLSDFCISTRYGEKLKQLQREQKEKRENKWTSPTETELQNRSSETLEEGASVVLSQLDYAELPNAIQGQVIDDIISDFQFLDTLTFRNCAELTDLRLKRLTKNLPLKKITLIGCENIDGTGLLSIIMSHSNVHIVLDGIESLSDKNLASLIKFSKHLTLVIAGNHYDVSNISHLNELFKHALSGNNKNLLKALLIAGAHLRAFGDQAAPPLHLACEAGQVEIVKTLIEFGVPVNSTYVATVKNPPGQSIISRSVSALDVAWELREQSALDISRKTSAHKIIMLLLEHGAVYCEKPKEILSMALAPFVLRALSIEMKMALLRFAYCHHDNKGSLLTHHLIPQLVSTKETNLDLSKPQHFAMVNFKLSSELIVAIQKSMPNLTQMNIVGCDGITKETMQQILALNLQSLSIDFNQAENGELLTTKTIEKGALLRIGKTEIKIVSVNLSGIPLTDIVMPKLCSFIEHSRVLEELKLSNCKITTAQIKSLAISININGNMGGILTSLELNNNSLGAEGIIALCEQLAPDPDVNKGQADKSRQDQLAPHPRLTKVSLENNKADHHCAKALGLLLQHRVVTELSVLGNLIGNEGIKVIASHLAKPMTPAGIKKSNCLRVLNLNECGMSIDGLNALIPILEQIRSLTALDMRYNKIGDAGVIALTRLVEANRRINQLYDITQSRDLMKHPGFKEDYKPAISNQLLQELQKRVKQNQDLFEATELDALTGSKLNASMPTRAESLLPLEVQRGRLMGHAIKACMLRLEQTQALASARIQSEVPVQSQEQVKPDTDLVLQASSRARLSSENKPIAEESPVATELNIAKEQPAPQAAAAKGQRPQMMWMPSRSALKTPASAPASPASPAAAASNLSEAATGSKIISASAGRVAPYMSPRSGDAGHAGLFAAPKISCIKKISDCLGRLYSSKYTIIGEANENFISIKITAPINAADRNDGDVTTFWHQLQKLLKPLGGQLSLNFQTGQLSLNKLTNSPRTEELKKQVIAQLQALKLINVDDVVVMNPPKLV